MDTSTASASALLGLDEPICPYTGLRTFTENEAIYFRGRERHVAKCLALLVEQRFVMITGASGDGKSSLVFAGMLPEVRAGFVRARYSSWAVATFRPERSPLRNLAQALAPALRLPSSRSVETELEQGFSSLVQLYQASELCPPATLPEGLAPAELRQQQRQAANLLLVVDQFEEFFTNPENYDGDHPNTSAQTVVNLLLETARLAQADNLPIYIICTMRSDFVGQCAEFRGLIEQVGASQYFVPRLLRHEFLEVIKEPAVLSGNRISERLVQRLLYDIGQGQDQLPVLQHALRRIWLAADHGREEMDLIHYAMVGGLSDELPADDQERFAAWRATLPAHQQQFLLGNPGLRNVLDAHANQLYFEANDLYNRDFQPALPPGTAERVIEQTFRVLTRTDGKRVVRNRLTGTQITAILADEALPWPVVCRILRPFRAEGTTFLSPFLSDDDDGHTVLPADTVFDISHESLIRNWSYLTEWARSEATDVRVAQSFIQQTSRWQDNAESRDFLLPIGFYTFFSQWHSHKKGAASWLAYYLNAGPDATNQEQAAAENDVLTRFLEASKRRLRFPLLAARYGAWRLAAAVLLPLLLLALGWVAWKHRQQQDDYVAYAIVRDRTPLLASPFISVKDKAQLLLNADRLKDVLYRPWLGGGAAADYAFPHALDALQNDTLALDIELNMYASVDNMAYDSVERANPCIEPVLLDLESRLARAGSITKPERKGGTTLSERQRRVAVFTARTVMALAYYLSCDAHYRASRPAPVAAHRKVRAHFEAGRGRLLRELREHLRQEIATTTGPAPSPVAFSFCLRVLLSQGNDSPAELAFLTGMSPFEHPDQYIRLFPPDLTLYARESSTPQSGGPLTMAMAYAALRQPVKVGMMLTMLAENVELGMQKNNLTEVNSGIALLPYLVKYELFTPDSIHYWLNACTKVGGVPFNTVYAATVYSLLSVQPTRAVFDVSQAYSNANLNKQDGTRLGGVDPGYLNSDRLSFSLPLATRDKAWQALAAATTDIAAREAIFIENETPGEAEHNVSPAATNREALFLHAFLAKMHGVYLQEIEHQPGQATASFAQFSSYLQLLQQHLRASHLLNQRNESAQVHRVNKEQINAAQWSLGPPQMPQQLGGADPLNTGAQNPITYLRLPNRPKTLAFETYYTCPFDAFFAYELQQEAARPAPNLAVVRLLDSLAFVEAIFPDRFSSTRASSLQAEGLARSAQYRPNLAWIRAVVRAPLQTPAIVARLQRLEPMMKQHTGPDEDVAFYATFFGREERNALLLTLAEALQDRRKLARIDVKKLTSSGAPFAVFAGAFGFNDFSTMPLQLACSDVAAALARDGRMAEAFALANFRLLDEPWATIIKIRASEQAMLTNNQQAQALIDPFLAQYQQRISNKPQIAASSIFPLLYWRPYPGHRQDADFQNLASFLAEEQNSTTGIYALCKGYSLAGQSDKAFEQIPVYQSERLRQAEFNYILLSLAHLKTHQPADGWREYDEAELTQPADYDGPVY